MPRIPDPRFNKIAAAVATLLTLAAVTAFGVAPLREAELPTPETIVESLALEPQVAETAGDFIQAQQIRRGETVASLLERLGAADSQILRFVADDPIARRLLRLQTGRTVTAEVDASGRVMWLQYRYGSLDAAQGSGANRLTIRRDGESLNAIDEMVPLERGTVLASAEIKTSLFAATDAAGIPDSIATKVADILDGEVDFRRDLRRGAQLRVMYETIREADSLDAAVGNRVLAVQLINDGDHHEAVWFDRKGRVNDGGGEAGEFYDFSGRSLRKSFLSNPIEFSRVTSGFSNGRLHPVFGDRRAHKGVDFAAPSGTPVRVAGDGVVDFAGQQRGYGNVVIVEHNNGITTLYAHLRGFANSLRAGDKLSQGEIIGYVGMTGWATGPHLHYEFMVKGTNVDPMTVVASNAKPLDKTELERFTAARQRVDLQFAQLDPTRKLARFE